MISSIKLRFKHILSLDNDSLLAAVLCPQFKLIWLNVIKNSLPSFINKDYYKIIPTCSEFLLDHHYLKYGIEDFDPEQSDIADFNENTNHLILFWFPVYKIVPQLFFFFVVNDNE